MSKLNKCFRLWIAYCGLNYFGYQLQRKYDSLELKIRESFLRFSEFKGVLFIAASRTDAGVHARVQVLSCYFSYFISKADVLFVLNYFLPHDIFIYRMDEIVGVFHAKNHSLGKHYLYRVGCTYHADPFNQLCVYYFGGCIDVYKIQRAALLFLGKNDLSSFRSQGCNSIIAVRYIWDVEIFAKYKEIIFSFKGNAFCYNMIRILVGILLITGTRRVKLKMLNMIFYRSYKNKLWRTAPAIGLTLFNIYYPDNLLKKVMFKFLFSPKFPVFHKTWLFSILGSSK